MYITVCYLIVRLEILLFFRAQFSSLSERIVLSDLEQSLKLDVVSRLWKYGHYPVIEAFRRAGGEGWRVWGVVPSLGCVEGVGCCPII